MKNNDWSHFWDEFHISELNTKIESMFPEYGFDINNLLESLLKGDIFGAIHQGLTNIFYGMNGQFVGMRNIMLYLIILSIVSALLFHFSDVFENHQIADMSFYLAYLFLMTILLKCFQEGADTACIAIQQILLFIKLFLPTFFIVLGIIGNGLTASAGYGIAMVLIFIVEQILLSFVIPLIYTYVILIMINGIWSEEKLVFAVDFLGKGIRLLLKTCFGIVTGIGFFQSMITPVIDSIKTQTVQKTISYIPGIGDVADGVVEMMVGSAVLIKNSLGGVFVIILLAICIVPLIKIFTIAVCLKSAAAFMGIISDRRISNCTNRVGEGNVLLLKTTATSMLLFIVLIAIVSYTTNHGM